MWSSAKHHLMMEKMLSLKAIVLLLLMLVSMHEAISPEDGNSFSEFVLEKTLKVFAPTSEVVMSETCKRQAGLFARGVREGVGWAMQMFDASSKANFTVQSRQGFHLGSYKECLSLENIQTDDGPINGRHCLVTIGAQTWGTYTALFMRIGGHARDLEDKLRLVGSNKWDYDNINSSPAKAGLVWSLCVPASCTPHDVRAHLQATLPGEMPVNESLLVSHVECTSRVDLPGLTVGDWLIVAVILLIISLVLLGTWTHIYPRSPGLTCDALQAFSLLGGSRELFNMEPQTGSGMEHRLPVLDGIRVLTMTSLFLFHSHLIWDHFYPPPNRSFLDDVRFQRSNYTASIHVDTFILLSGLLVCFNYLRERQRGANFSLTSFYLNRFIRVAPLFWLVVIIMRSNLPYFLGEGPLFKASVQETQIHLIENLPQVLAFLGNFLPQEKIVPLHGWSLAVDMQLCVLAPVFTYLLYTAPKVGQAIIAVLLQVSLVICYLVTTRYPYNFLALPSGHNMELFWFSTYMRLTPWLVGLGLGYALHVTVRKPVLLSRLHVTACWILSAAMMVTALWMGPVVLETGNRQLVEVFYTFQKTLWVVGLAWVIFACSRGYGGRATAVLTWRGFLVPSRLSFAFYLLHVIVIAYFASTMRTAPQHNTLTKVTHLFRDLICSLVFATVIHLALELPVIKLRKVLLKTHKSRSLPSSEKDE